MIKSYVELGTENLSELLSGMQLLSRKVVNYYLTTKI